MATHEPPAKAIDVGEAQRSLPSTMSEVARTGERIVIEEDGVAVAALVPMRDLERLARLDAEREERFKVLDRIGAAFAHETEEESERYAALALAEAREDMRREREARHQA
jgi:antitoxin (DNA-binding transcriptional repressor) of toxin-antitoxin stability system